MEACNFIEEKKESDYLLKLSMPLFFKLSKKEKSKNYHLNLNNYHNWHFQVRNNLKKLYAEHLIEKLVNKKPISNSSVVLTFVMHRPDKRRVDRANVLCLHEKFACDALVEIGILEDDSDKHVHSTHYYTGEIDKLNPRVDIFVTGVH